MKAVTLRKEHAVLSKLTVQINRQWSVPEVPANCARSIYIPVDRHDYEIELTAQETGRCYLNRVPLSFLCSKYPESVKSFPEMGYGPYFEIDLTGMGSHIMVEMRALNESESWAPVIHEVRGL